MRAHPRQSLSQSPPNRLTCPTALSSPYAYVRLLGVVIRSIDAQWQMTARLAAIPFLEQVFAASPRIDKNVPGCRARLDQSVVTVRVPVVESFP